MPDITACMYTIARLQAEMMGLGRFVHSSFVYGSVARWESDRTSDLDVMVVLSRSSLGPTELQALSDINARLVGDFRGQLTFRLRNLDDIECSTSGATDYGPTSLLNYLRDAWYVAGEDLTPAFLTRLRSCSEEELAVNLRTRISEVRKRARALVSHHAQQLSSANHGPASSFEYAAGDLLYELAEVLCHVEGTPCSSRWEMLEVARKLTSLEVFADAPALRLGEGTVDKATFVAQVESVVNDVWTCSASRLHRLISTLDVVSRAATISAGALDVVLSGSAGARRATLRAALRPPSGVSHGPDLHFAEFEGTCLHRYIVHSEDRA